MTNWVARNAVCSCGISIVDLDKRKTEDNLHSDSCLLLFLPLFDLSVSVIKAMICLDFWNSTALLVYSIPSIFSMVFFSMDKKSWAGWWQQEKKRQGNSVWLYRQWAIGALQSSINSMCTAICSQCLCPDTAALTLQAALCSNVRGSHINVCFCLRLSKKIKDARFLVSTHTFVDAFRKLGSIYCIDVLFNLIPLQIIFYFEYIKENMIADNQSLTVLNNILYKPCLKNRL